MKSIAKALLFLLLAGCAAQPPAPLKPVNVIVFPGGFNWPIWVAQEKGLFASNGVEVKLTLPGPIEPPITTRCSTLDANSGRTAKSNAMLVSGPVATSVIVSRSRIAVSRSRV